MSSISGVSSAYSTYEASSVNTSSKTAVNTAAESTKASTATEAAATFERTTTDEQIAEKVAAKKTYKPDRATIDRLKQDADARTEQLRSLVEKIITKQADKTTSIFDFLGQEYSAEDIAKAKEDVSEDGYWGVNQTSQRILDFATALTGGDPDKIEDMRSAFEKGFNQAKKAFGGELPEISQQTYDAVMKGFDDMKNKVEE